MKNDNERLRRLCVMALLCAMAYAAVALIRIPAVAFLKYEPKDVLLVIGGFLLGPLDGMIMCAVVAAVEAVTISDTGAIGLLPVFLPFNLLKCALNATLAVLLYKGVSRALRAARLLPQSSEGKTGRRFPAWLPALFVFATLVVILLVWSGKI
mgnify:CR=1 FL=1